MKAVKARKNKSAEEAAHTGGTKLITFIKAPFK